MLARMGIDPRPKSAEELDRPPPARRWRRRVLPADIDFTLEMVVGRMVGLLLIEISAFHGFRWAEEVLGDVELVAGDGEAATPGLLHPGRRDPPCRLPPHRPLRDA